EPGFAEDPAVELARWKRGRLPIEARPADDAVGSGALSCGTRLDLDEWLCVDDLLEDLDEGDKGAAARAYGTQASGREATLGADLPKIGLQGTSIHRLQIQATRAAWLARRS